MLRWKIIIAVALYIILGLVAYFNFGFHHLMMERVGVKSTQNKSAWKKLEENIKKNAQPQVLPEFQDSILDEALNQTFFLYPHHKWWGFLRGESLKSTMIQ
jgi:hypothetical protein